MHRTTRGSFLKTVAGAALAYGGQWSGGKGKWYPGESRTYRDPDTGREVRQLTSAPFPSYNLYFTAHELHSRQPGPGLHVLRGRKRPSCISPTWRPAGSNSSLKPRTGAYHACVCQRANTVAYLDNGAVWSVDLKTLEQRKLYAIPKGPGPTCSPLTTAAATSPSPLSAAGEAARSRPDPSFLAGGASGPTVRLRVGPMRRISGSHSPHQPG